MKRYEKFVLEEEKGITFEVSEETSGELIIRARNTPTVSAGEYAEVLSVYTDNDGNKAVVPPGWTVSGASEENIIWGKNKGLVIYRIPKENVNGINWSSEQEIKSLQRIYDQFVWVPVSLLEANGTLDGVLFTEKFGRRNYRNEEFSEKGFHEALKGELALHLESVKKHGGFYISRYHISKSSEGKLHSVKGVMPCGKMDFYNAKKAAYSIEKNEEVNSHLTIGAEYDSVLEWFIESNARSYRNIVEDSTNWGNYRNTENSLRKLFETGSKEGWCTNNIYDFAGNMQEWTQEQYERDCYVIRSGSFCDYGFLYPAVYRFFCIPQASSSAIGVRATLYIRSYFTL